MFVDLDRFKELNDRYGHAAGDELLRIIGGRLRETVRGEDLVGRIGGDEFLVMCPDVGGPEAAMTPGGAPGEDAARVRAPGRRQRLAAGEHRRGLVWRRRRGRGCAGGAGGHGDVPVQAPALRSAEAGEGGGASQRVAHAAASAQAQPRRLAAGVLVTCAGSPVGAACAPLGVVARAACGCLRRTPAAARAARRWTARRTMCWRQIERASALWRCGRIAPCAEAHGAGHGVRARERDRRRRPSASDAQRDPSAWVPAAISTTRAASVASMTSAIRRFMGRAAVVTRR